MTHFICRLRQFNQRMSKIKQSYDQLYEHLQMTLMQQPYNYQESSFTERWYGSVVFVVLRRNFSLSFSAGCRLCSVILILYDFQKM